MRKSILLFSIIIFILFISCIDVFATTPEGYFTFDSSTGTITGYDKTGGRDVVIPETIGGVTVTAIGAYAFNIEEFEMTSVVIPNTVTNIGNYAFQNNRFTSVTIPDSVISIGNYAFSGCLMNELSLPDTVESIGSGAFQYNNLTEVNIPHSLEYINSNLFRGNKLTEVDIPEGTGWFIGGSAFSDNDLTSVIIPNGVTRIDAGAFSGNELLSVIIPDSVTGIRNYAFQYNNLSSVIIPEGVTSIGRYTFANNSISSVTIPSSVTTVDTDAFSNNQAISTDLMITGYAGTAAETYANVNTHTFVALAYNVSAISDIYTPTAGSSAEITFTVKDSLGNTDTGYNGDKTITITGYEEASNGSYGSINETALESDGSTDVTISFTDGMGTVALILNKADEQTIAFSIDGVATPETNTLTMTPVAGEADSMTISTDITAPASNGGEFNQQPVITLKDQFGNVCTEDNSTVVTASKNDSGDWTLTGTKTVTAAGGIITFTDLGTENPAQVDNAQLLFSATELTDVTGDQVTLPAPDAPVAPTIQIVSADDASVTIKWDSVIGATGYSIYMSTTSGAYVGSSDTLDASTLSCEITGLTNGTTYYFVVKASNGGGDSGNSNEVSATPKTVPEAPVLLSATAGNQEVVLNWESVSNATSYTLYQGTESRTYSAIKVLQDTTYTVGGLTNGNTYYFAVKATNEKGDGGFSNEMSATPQVPAPGAPVLQSATAGNQKVTIIWSQVSGATGYTIYQGTESRTYSAINVVAETDTTYTSDGLTNGITYYFAVSAINPGGESGYSNEAGATPKNTSNSTSRSKATKDTEYTETDSSDDVEVLVGDEEETVATMTTSKEDNQTITTILIDDDKIEEKLREENENIVVSISTQNNPDVVISRMTGQTVMNMANKKATLEIKTEDVTYKLPAEQVNIGNVKEKMGQDTELKDILFNVRVSKPPQEKVQIIEDSAKKNSYQIVVEPVEFKVTCKNNEKTIEVSRFNAYVERMISIPKGVDPAKVTTGVVLNSDGTFSHVPTEIVEIDGKYYAKIKSLTNSTYLAIYNPVEFEDVANHWAKETINDMGSRLVIGGVGSNCFEPDRDITRAEFAAILTKALGLKSETEENLFNDVHDTDWHCDFVRAATEYKIISGYGNGEFGPLDKITREQAITMIARAMEITGLDLALEPNESHKILESYKDSGEISEWARESAAICIKAGVISGKGDQGLKPRDSITRAEVAVIVQRLLKSSELI